MPEGKPMNTYLTEAQIKEMAEAVLTTLEVTPLTHKRKCEVALEHSIDEFGVRPYKSAVLLAVKLANIGWSMQSLRLQRLPN